MNEAKRLCIKLIIANWKERLSLPSRDSNNSIIEYLKAIETSQKCERNIAMYSECIELVYRVSDDVWLCVTVGVTRISMLFGLSILYLCRTT